MKHTKFPQATHQLQRPAGMTEEECDPLWVFVDNNEYVISCWNLSFKERLSALIFGRVWLWVWSGFTQPPVALQCKKSIFRTVVKKRVNLEFEEPKDV